MPWAGFSMPWPGLLIVLVLAAGCSSPDAPATPENSPEAIADQEAGQTMAAPLPPSPAVQFNFTGRVSVPTCVAEQFCYEHDTSSAGVHQYVGHEFVVPTNATAIHVTLTYEEQGPSPDSSNLDFYLWNATSFVAGSYNLDNPQTLDIVLAGNRASDAGTWTLWVYNSWAPPTDYEAAVLVTRG